MEIDRYNPAQPTWWDVIAISSLQMGLWLMYLIFWHK